MSYQRTVQQLVIDALELGNAGLAITYATALDAVQQMDPGDFPSVVVMLPVETACESLTVGVQRATLTGDLLLFQSECRGEYADSTQSDLINDIRAQLATVESKEPGIERNAIRLTVGDYLSRGQDVALRLRYTVPVYLAP